MRFRVSGVDAKSGDEVEIDIEADSQKAAFEIAKQKHRIVPRSATTRGGSNWVYKMVQIPPTIEIGEKEEKRRVAAGYLESVVNKYAEKGWEFYRVDQIGVRVNPGCLAGLLGVPAQHTVYYVVTFRQWVEASAP